MPYWEESKAFLRSLYYLPCKHRHLTYPNSLKKPFVNLFDTFFGGDLDHSFKIPLHFLFQFYAIHSRL